MEEVAAYLTVKGLNRSEAAEIAYKVYKERADIVRRNGILKIIAGLFLISLPLTAYIRFEITGHIWIRKAVWYYVFGILGAYMLITGIMAVVSPKSEKGAVDKE